VSVCVCVWWVSLSCFFSYKASNYSNSLITFFTLFSSPLQQQQNQEPRICVPSTKAKSARQEKDSRSVSSFLAKRKICEWSQPTFSLSKSDKHAILSSFCPYFYLLTYTHTQILIHVHVCEQAGFLYFLLNLKEIDLLSSKVRGQYLKCNTTQLISRVLLVY